MEAAVALRKFILTDAVVTGLIVARYYPDPLPQDSTLPAITYMVVSNPRHPNLPFAFPRVQVTCWAETRDGARAVAKAIIDKADRWKGVQSGVHFKRVSKQNDLDIYDPERKLYKVPVDFKLLYQDGM